MISEILIEYWRKLFKKLNTTNSNIYNNNTLKIRQYLIVPYAEKDEAKQLGAIWDNKTKAWFIPEERETLPFEKWIPKREQAIYIEPNIRTKVFYIVESKEQCWKCHKITKVFGFLIPRGTEHIEDIYDEDKGNSNSEWVKFEYDFFITYVKWLNEETLTIMQNFSSNYYYDFSKSIEDKYYINHCEHYGSNQGDHFMFGEPGGAFCPLSITEAKQIKIYGFEQLFTASADGYSGVDFLGYMENKMCRIFIDENQIVEQTSQAKNFFYDDGEVSKELLEAAIDFMISIEPNPTSPTCEQEFQASRKQYATEIKMVYAAIRQYGHQISNKTIEGMQDVFYSITNSDKYLQSSKHTSVAYTLLNYYWDGIGSWRR